LADRVLFHRGLNDGLTTVALSLPSQDIAFSAFDPSDMRGKEQDRSVGKAWVFWGSHAWVVRETPAQIRKALGLKS
jgi:hypothetical protein